MQVRKFLIRAMLACALLPATVFAQKAGGTMVMLVQPEPPTLASYAVASQPVGQIGSKIYDGLLEYDFQLKPLPSLAESWTVSEDGKTLTFKLRHGVTFHDGKPFTSADAQFSLRDVLSKFHPRGIATFREVESYDTPDAYTLVLRLKQPAPYIMSALSGYESPMLPKHLLEGTDLRNAPLANNPVGTGPYKFVEWRRGEYIRLEKNPSYWKPNRPYLNRLVARFIPDPATRTSLLEKGEVQFAGIGAVPYNDVKKFSTAANTTVTSKGNEMLSNVVELTLNNKRPYLDKAKVRQAIAYAVDRQQIIDTVFFGYGKPAAGPISSNFAPTGFYSDAGLQYAAPDRLARANRLLDEAGYPRKADGMRFELVHDVLPYGEEWRRFGELLQQQLGAVGIKLTLRTEDVPSWLRRVFTSYDFDITTNFLFNLADPAIGVHRGLHSNAIKQGTPFVNASRWSNKAADDLMDRATTETQPQKRAALYQQLGKLVAEEVPNIYVIDLNYPAVINKQLKDVITSPLGVYGPFDQAWLDK